MTSTPRELRNFIGGSYVETAADTTSDIVNPATASVVATAPVSVQADVDRGLRRRGEGLRDVG